MSVVRRLILVLPLVGCSSADCLSLPCPLPIAISLTIASTDIGGSIPAAIVDVTGAGQSSFSCRGTCAIPGTAGTYHIVVTAPGFAHEERSVQVRGTNPECGCATAATQSVTIGLSASPASLVGRDHTPAI